ncbi:MAG: SpaA isopeptide-forming pilin-related protein [Planctomycetota bacterium]|jgi:hypothetical protein
MRSIAVSTFTIILVLMSAGAALGETSWTVTVLDPNLSTSASASGNTGTQQVGTANFGYGSRAALWTGTPGSFVNLNPPGALSSTARAMAGDQQVGWGNFSNGAHAVIWTGTGGGYVDLNPSGARTSRALATTGTQQGGWATFDWEVPVAALWSGSAGSFVNLNPSGAKDSQVYGMSGSQQVGVAGFGNFGLNPSYRRHAALWTGTAASFVDLNPSGFSNSYAYATTGTQQAGVADGHAAIWSGTAASFVDLNPAGAYDSAAHATTGTYQVGYANDAEFGGVGKACMWEGTAASFMDLDVLLPPAVRGSGSWASAIYVSGRDIWVAGGTLSGNAILWHGVIPDLTIKTFFDCNENGVYEPAGDDKLLAGWQFEVKDSNGAVVGTYTSDANGEVILDSLSGGDYTITETVKKDHYVTGTAGNPRVISVAVGGDTVAWFGNKLDGDINQDGLVDTQDFTILKANMGSTGTTWTQGNINLDGLTDTQDFTILKVQLGKGEPPGP